MRKRIKKFGNFKRLYQKAEFVIGSRKFFYLILLIFAVEALWVAFSFRYPMLYDEGYHFNLIQLFSHGYSPILNNQPASLDIYGDMVHHGSTLFHYLMSFPYRIFSHVTSSMTWQIIFLRTIDILLFGVGIWMYNKTFKKVGLKQIHINLAALFLILLPIVPFVAATINYDNLLFPLCALTLYLGVLIIQAKKPDWQLYLGFVMVGVLALLVKLEFGPIFAITLFYLLFDQLIKYKWEFVTSISGYFKKRAIVGSLILIGLLTSFILIGQGYIKDYTKYHTLMPSCQQLLSTNRCSKSFIFQYGKELKATKNQRPTLAIHHAAKTWLDEMEHFMGLTGANVPGKAAIYAPPLPIAYKTWYLATALGFFATVAQWSKWRRLRGSSFLFTVFVVYTLAVLGFNLHSYYQNHAFTAVQPRYLLQTLPIFLVLMIYSFDKLLTGVEILKPLLVTIIFVLMLDGGGIVSPIYRSYDNWYWQKHTTIRINNKLKRIVDPIVTD